MTKTASTGQKPIWISTLGSNGDFLLIDINSVVNISTEFAVKAKQSYTYLICYKVGLLRDFSFWLKNGVVFLMHPVVY